MLKLIRLYLCNNSGRVEHIVYYWKATDEENSMKSFVEYDNLCATSSKGNKLDTYVREALNVV